MEVDLKALFYYDLTSPSGLRRKTDWWCGRDYRTLRAQAGEPAGFLPRGSRCSYYEVKAGHTRYKAHRVIWELFNGKIAEGYQIDHIDGNPLNNAIENLRCVDNATNGRNQKFRSTNTSKVCGVNATFIPGTKIYGYWRAQWSNTDGKRRTKCFSITKLGNGEAFRLACEHREAMVGALNLQGAGYTESHGTRS